MIKFILPLTVLCGTISAVNLRNPTPPVEYKQYEVIRQERWTFPDEQYMFVVHDRVNDLYGVFVISYFDQILRNFDFDVLIREYPIVPYEYVKGLKELKHVTEDQYGFY